ncbi:hypothetical protein, partial [Terrimonas pollutisoli]|uniref:hypothetical protein n=1 Tax=Terrimonas pollutisoli TaxID=3034147 RepID=UPI0023EB48F1
LATQAGSLFVLHLNIFTMNNLAKQKPLTLSEASQTTEGLVQQPSWRRLLIVNEVFIVRLLVYSIELNLKIYIAQTPTTHSKEVTSNRQYNFQGKITFPVI